jgi:RNA polymerase sigma factor (sigma-70 family)
MPESPESADALTRESAGLLLIGVAPELTQYVYSKFPAGVERWASPEDVFQAVCLAVLEKAPEKNFRDTGDFASWVHGIALHKVFDAMRYAGRASKVEEGGGCVTPWLKRDAEGRALVTRQSPEIETPSSVARRKEMRHAVGSALARLPEKHRRALELCYVDKLPRKKAAAALGVTVEGLKWILKSAKAHARAAIGDPSRFIDEQRPRGAPRSREKNRDARSSFFGLSRFICYNARS